MTSYTSSTRFKTGAGAATPLSTVPSDAQFAGRVAPTHASARPEHEIPDRASLDGSSTQSNQSHHSAEGQPQPAKGAPSDGVPGGKFACRQCNKQFTRSSDVDRHISGNHLKLKPFHCEYCDKAFSQNSNMTRHERTCLARPASAQADSISHMRTTFGTPSTTASPPSLVERTFTPAEVPFELVARTANVHCGPARTAPPKLATVDEFGPRTLPPLAPRDDHAPRANLPPLWSLRLPGGPPPRGRLLSMPAVGQPRLGSAQISVPPRLPPGPQPAHYRLRTTSVAAQAGVPPPVPPPSPIVQARAAAPASGIPLPQKLARARP